MTPVRSLERRAPKEGVGSRHRKVTWGGKLDQLPGRGSCDRPQPSLGASSSPFSCQASSLSILALPRDKLS